MALKFLDSFQHYGTPQHAADKWGGSSIITSAALSPNGGPNGRPHIILSGTDTLIRSLGTVTRTLTAGVAWKGDDAIGTEVPLIYFLDAFGTMGTRLGINSSVDPLLTPVGRLHVSAGGSAPYNTNSGAWDTDITQWHYYEISVYFDDDQIAQTGHVEVRVDGVVRIHDLTVPSCCCWTQPAMVGIGNGLGLDTPIGHFADFYCLDDSGSVNNTFMVTQPGASMAVDYCNAKDAGASQESAIGGSAPAGTRAGGVMELAPDDGVTFNKLGTGEKDLYTVDPSRLQSNLLPRSTQVVARCESDTTLTVTNRLIVRSHIAETESTDLAAVQAYGYDSFVSDVSPNTGVAYSRTELDAIQAGMRKTG